MKAIAISAIVSAMATLSVNYVFLTHCSSQTCVGVQSRTSALVAMPDGGPQALEGYTTIAHDRGLVKLALGTIGNVEMNARGDVAMVRSLQAGGVVTNDGRVQQWSGLYLSRPRAGEGYAGAVNVQRFDYVTFDNGWSIRPDGDRLLICDSKGICRGL